MAANLPVSARQRNPDDDALRLAGNADDAGGILA
jgi:hypothetical protein